MFIRSVDRIFRLSENPFSSNIRSSLAAIISDDVLCILRIICILKVFLILYISACAGFNTSIPPAADELFIRPLIKWNIFQA